MKSRFYQILFPFTILAFVSFSSCERKNSASDQDIPMALQAQSTIMDISYVKGRGGGNILDELFDEILDKRAEVKQAVEDQKAMIDKLSKAIADLQADDENSMRYYIAAKGLVESMPDTIAQQKWRRFIDASESSWKAQLLPRDNMVEQFKADQSKLQQNLIVLKIRLTLSQIEDFQSKKQPNLATYKDLHAETSKIAQSLQAISAQ